MGKRSTRAGKKLNFGVCKVGPDAAHGNGRAGRLCYKPVPDIIARHSARSGKVATICRGNNSSASIDTRSVGCNQCCAGAGIALCLHGGRQAKNKQHNGCINKEVVGRVSFHADTGLTNGENKSSVPGQRIQ